MTDVPSESLALGAVGLAIMAYSLVGILRRQLVLYGRGGCRTEYTGWAAIRNGMVAAILGLAFVLGAFLVFWLTR